MTKTHVTTKVNGDTVEFLADPRASLLDCLRDNLGLTGSKEGCGTGDCGACSVTLDGTLVCSCLVLGVEAEGREIGTIEGVAEGEALHPLQRKFIEHAALQCGFCTPGFLMTVSEILETEELCSDEEIRDALSGNLCRCTGYEHIVRAVRELVNERDGVTA